MSKVNGRLPQEFRTDTQAPTQAECVAVAKEAIIGDSEIRLPLGPSSDTGYPPGHVEVQFTQKSGQAQARALRRLFVGLQTSHAQLANGRHVDTYSDAIRYFLEQLK